MSDNMVDKIVCKSDNLKLDNCLYFRIPYHPHDISRQNIRNIYENICECEPQELGNFKSLPNEETGNIMTIDRLTVAYHKPKNLRDLLCPSALSESNSCKVSLFV